MMEIVENSGSGFAAPSQAVRFVRDSGIDEEKARAAEQQVRQWRDQHELPFPDFVSAAKKTFCASFFYPPPSSSIGGKDLLRRHYRRPPYFPPYLPPLCGHSRQRVSRVS